MHFDSCKSGRNILLREVECAWCIRSSSNKLSDPEVARVESRTGLASLDSGSFLNWIVHFYSLFRWQWRFSLIMRRKRKLFGLKNFYTVDCSKASENLISIQSIFYQPTHYKGLKQREKEKRKKEEQSQIKLGNKSKCAVAREKRETPRKIWQQVMFLVWKIENIIKTWRCCWSRSGWRQSRRRKGSGVFQPSPFLAQVFQLQRDCNFKPRSAQEPPFSTSPFSIAVSRLRAWVCWRNICKTFSLPSFVFPCHFLGV